MSRRFAIILAVCIALFGGILFFTKNDANAPSSADSSAQLSSHTKGEGKSAVVLIEYGDFQCSACYRYEPIMRQVRQKYSAAITFQFRNLPLFQIHKNALVASRAAEAASLQGKFWEMHDKLYETQDPTGQTGWVASNDPATYFVTFAGDLGLDTVKFTADLKDSKTNDTVQADLKEAQRLGLESTPSFVLDGKVLENTRDDINWFSKVIDDAIKAKNPSN